MRFWTGILLVWGFLNGSADAWAFRFISPADGAVVAAGSTVLLELDPEGVEGLMAVLFTGSLGILREKLDPFPPWSWSLQIPPSFVGKITFTATGRVLGQRTGWAPRAEVIIHVVLPTQPTALRR